MNNAIIREAILKKRVIEFYYDGGLRIVEPHCLGLSTAGNFVLRGFQTSGHSLSGGIPDWRLFKIAEMRQLKVLENVFLLPRPEYKRGDKGMKSIVAEL